MTLIEQLDASGLTGRGGAAFSTGTKVRAAIENRAALIVNACDGEIGATKDAWVVENHLADLVQGAKLIAPGRLGGIRYAAHRGSATASRLAAAGLEVLEVPHRYVSSEESALISLASGQLARPMTKRTPFVYGGRDVQGRQVAPTVVLNAETVWRVAQIADRGSAWFRSFGTPTEPGPRLVTIGGSVHSPGVFAAAAGIPLADLLRAAGAAGAEGAGGIPGPVWLGGLGGFFLTEAEAAGAIWSNAGLAAYGGSTGPGVINVLAPDRCPLAQVSSLLSYAAGESAGQCGPCMFGLPAVSAQWAELIARPTSRAVDQFSARVDLLIGRGACRFPDGVAGMVRSALRVFGPHLAEHAAGNCPLEGKVAHAYLA